jgi:hypothetical protein
LARVANEIIKDGEALRLWLANNEIAPQLETVAASINELMGQLSELTRIVGRDSVALLRQDLTPLLGSLKRSADGLHGLLKTLSQQPNALIFGGARPEKPLPGGVQR